VFLGEWLWASTRGLIVGLIAALFTVIYGLYTWQQVLISLPLLCLGSLIFAAFGMIVGGVVKHIDQVSIFHLLIIVPMFNISGTYFPRNALPDVVRWVAEVLPLASLLDLLRWPLGLPAHWLYSLLWLLALAVTLPVIAARIIYPQLVR
jgi:lipooligosaccharide transport system permease protein